MFFGFPSRLFRRRRASIPDTAEYRENGFSYQVPYDAERTAVRNLPAGSDASMLYSFVNPSDSSFAFTWSDTIRSFVNVVASFHCLPLSQNRLGSIVSSSLSRKIAGQIADITPVVAILATLYSIVRSVIQEPTF